MPLEVISSDKGEVEVTTDNLRFGNWDISPQSVELATLATDYMFFIPTMRVLTISTNEHQFSFALRKPLDVTLLPFETIVEKDDRWRSSWWLLIGPVGLIILWLIEAIW